MVSCRKIGGGGGGRGVELGIDDFIPSGLEVEADAVAPRNDIMPVCAPAWAARAFSFEEPLPE